MQNAHGRGSKVTADRDRSHEIKRCLLPGREGNGTPLQYSCLETPMDGGAWWAAVHGVAKSRTRLSDFTFTFHFHALEKEMAPHSSVLAWRIPGTREPGELPSMESHRAGYDWSDLAAATPWKKSYDQPRQHTKNQRHHSADKGPHSQSYGSSSSRVWMWELDHKESWEPKNWCFRNVVLEKTLESPLDNKEIKPVNPKGNQPWIFIGRTDAKAPILWPPDVKSWLTGKDPNAGKYWGQEKGTTEDEMVGWHHQLNGHEFEQTPGDGEGQGSLVCCSPRGHKESDTTEWLNVNNNINDIMFPSSLFQAKSCSFVSTLLFSWNEVGFMMSLILQRRKLR